MCYPWHHRLEKEKSIYCPRPLTQDCLQHPKKDAVLPVLRAGCDRQERTWGYEPGGLGTHLALQQTSWVTLREELSYTEK